MPRLLVARLPAQLLGGAAAPVCCAISRSDSSWIMASALARAGVGAEKQLTAAGEHDSHVSLGAASVAAVGRSQRAGRKSCDHDTLLRLLDTTVSQALRGVIVVRPGQQSSTLKRSRWAFGALVR